MKPSSQEFQRLRFTLDAFADLSVHAVEAREFATAARSILYLLLGSVGVPRGMLFSVDTAGRLRAVAVKPHRAAAPIPVIELEGRVRAEFAQSPRLVSASDTRLRPAVREVLGIYGCSWLLPLVVRRRLAGALALGSRLNSAPLNDQESAALETLARYAAVLLHQHDLMRQLRGAVDENLRLCETLADTYLETVKAFSAAIDRKDLYTRGHSLRVARYSASLAAAAGFPRKAIAGIRIGAYLHDIGKLVLDRSLLNKPSHLNDAERKEIIAHPVVGFEVLSSVSFPWPEVRDVVRHHHERLDGRGYPDGLTGADIPLSARLLAIADSFDAMTSNRPYRERMPVTAALEELVDSSGTHFEPSLVRVFLEECRNDVAGVAARAAGARNGKRERPRLLGTLADAAAPLPALSFIDRLLRLLGPTPELQFA